MEAHCQIKDYLTLCAEALGVSIDRVLRRAGLSREVLSYSDKNMPPRVHFALWMGLLNETKRPDAELFLALTAAQGPTPPSVFAFSCADTLALGLLRLSMFKSLLGPVTLMVRQSPEGVSVSPNSSDHSAQLPPRLGLSELFYILECTRRFCGIRIVPAEVTLPANLSVTNEMVEYFGCTPRTGAKLTLVFSVEDAARPLISQDSKLWNSLERELSLQMVQVPSPNTLSCHIRSILRDSLAGGDVSTELVAKRLALSKRSLQRRLTEEGTNFKTLLVETRQQLAEYYLTQTDFSMSEISYLIGFTDSPSFFRAYKDWTGNTPKAARNKLSRVVSNESI